MSSFEKSLPNAPQMPSMDRTVERVTEKLSVPIRRARAISNPPEVSPAPHPEDPKYDTQLAQLASKILYRSGIDSSGNPMLVLSAAAFPDARDVDYNKLLPYVLAILPGENEIDELDSHGEKGSGGYSVIFFAGGGKPEKDSKIRPTWSWLMQAYSLLGRAVRKRIKKLWIVHERAWVRIMLEMLSGVVSQKFRRKVLHVGSLTELALEIDIVKLNIPPAVYVHDKRVSETITIPGFPPVPQFGKMPFTNDSPVDAPLPQVLTDASRYIRLNCLQQEGLFRIPPNTELLEIAREAYDRRQFLHLSDYGPNLAAGLIKLWYRVLPEPIIPVYCYEDLQKLETVADEDLIESARAILTQTLPKVSTRLLMRHLLPLLALVASHSDVNKMTATNLAICFAPSLVRSEDILLDAKLSRGGVAKFIECLIVNIEQFAPKMPDRQPKPAALTGDKYQSLSSIKRSMATASMARKQLNTYAKKNGDSPISNKSIDEDLLTSSPIQRQMSWTPIMSTMPTTGTTDPLTRAISEPITRVTSNDSVQSVSSVAASSTAATTATESAAPVTNGGIPSPPPSPTKEPNSLAKPENASPKLSRSPSNARRLSPSKARGLSPSRARDASPSRIRETSPSRTLSPLNTLGSSPSRAREPSPSMLSSSPPAGTPKIQGLMRATSSPLPPRNFVSTLSLPNANNGPKFPTLRKAPSDAQLNWQKASVKVKVAGSMVNELKALYEERAKGADVLVKTGSRRGRMN